MRLNDCLGVPVYFDSAYTGISESRGFLLWKKIIVGRSWETLSRREQGAILLHEVGHIKRMHAEKRLLPSIWMHLRFPLKMLSILRAKNEVEARSLWDEVLEDSGVAALARAQEFEADKFCADCGYGLDLAMAFSRMKTHIDPLHPSTEERLLRLNPMGGRSAI